MSPKHLQVVLFSGGRGTRSIIEALLPYEHVSLTLLMNAYDDGLSTGKIRAALPGLLGPSDARKLIVKTMADTDDSQRALRTLIDFRLPVDLSQADCLSMLRQLSHDYSVALAPLNDLILRLNLHQLKWISAYLNRFLFHLEKTSQLDSFALPDSAIGNLLFAGCYLDEDERFNAAIATLVSKCQCRATIINVTDGKNVVLTGLTKDGHYLATEADIVGYDADIGIHDVYLSERYLSEDETHELADRSIPDRHGHLRKAEIFPAINPDAAAAISEADIIIYGPGTQHSSLLPSYVTAGLAEAIAANTQSEKIFICNIRRDHDLPQENAKDLMQKFAYYMSRKGEIPEAMTTWVNQVFVQRQKGPDEDAAYVYYPEAEHAEADHILQEDWEAQGGVHLGGKVVDEILYRIRGRIDEKISPYYHRVSIILLTHNNEDTIAQSIQALKALDFSKQGLATEFVVADFGSTDNTVEIAKQLAGACLEVEAGEGRSSAIQLALRHVSGNIIVLATGPGYQLSDIHGLVTPIVNDNFKVVLGSRSIKCLTISESVFSQYSYSLQYFISKYGGMVMSFFTLFMFNKYVCDAFTDLKAFEKNLVRDLKVAPYKKGFYWDIDFIAKACKHKEYILEIPVNYTPEEAAKVRKEKSAWVGLISLYILVKNKLFGRRRAGAVAR